MFLEPVCHVWQFKKTCQKTHKLHVKAERVKVFLKSVKVNQIYKQ
jgi:hypothetical protein